MRRLKFFLKGVDGIIGALTLLISFSLVFAQQTSLPANDLSKKGPILVLWAPYGNGHKSAANAHINRLKAAHSDQEFVMLDVAELMSPALRKSSVYLFDKVQHHAPNLWHQGFENYMQKGEKAGTSAAMADRILHGFPTKKLGQEIQKIKPSMILHTWPFSVEMTALLKQRGEIPANLPIVWQHTDFFANAYVKNHVEAVDLMLSPSAGITEELVENFKADPNKILTTGIAVNPLAKEVAAWDRPKQEEFLKSHGLNPSKKTVTIFSGGNGVGDFPTLIDQVGKLASQGDEIQVVAITAKNKAMLDKLEKLKAGGKIPPHVNLKAMGFTDQKDVFGFMKSSQLLIGKAGGLSSSEALTIGVPTVFLNINRGQEEYNIRHFEKFKVGASVDREKDILPVAEKFLKDPSLGTRMTEAQKDFAQKSFHQEAFADWYQNQGQARLLTEQQWIRHLAAPKKAPGWCGSLIQIMTRPVF